MMSARWVAAVHRRFQPPQVARSLVTVLFLTLLQVAVGPTWTPNFFSPQANAADSNDFPSGISGTVIRYVADSYTAGATIWTDVNGANAATISANATRSSWSANNFGASQPVSAVRGSSTTSILFPSAVTQTSDYTLFYVARYVNLESSGAGTCGAARSTSNNEKRGRIFSSETGNWLSGFWACSAGVAYHEGWVTQSNANISEMTGANQNSWLLGADCGYVAGSTSTCKGRFRAFGTDRTSSASVSAAAHQIAINRGTFSSETSDFEIAEVIAVSTILPTADVIRVETYLSRKYGIPLAPTSGTKLGVYRSSLGRSLSVPFVIQPQIAIQDDSGQTITRDNSTVVTATVTGAGGSIVGSATATAIRGIATFENLGIAGNSGTQYTITYTSTGMTSTSESRDFISSSTETDTALSLSSGKYAWTIDSSELDVTSAITMEAWVFQTSTNAGWNMVMNKENSYELGTNGNVWTYALQGTGGSWSGVSTGIITRLNEWQHVALTRAAGANIAKFYLNGQEVFTGSADGASTGNLNNSSEPFTVGGRSSNGISFSSPFVGKIDEVRVFRSARTPAEISADMHSYGPIDTSNLALYYDFNEGAGNKLYNRASRSSTNSDLTVVGSPTWSDIKSVSDSGPYTVAYFPRSYLTTGGGWRIPAGVSRARALVVGGGGGGGNDEGGGGGGGGFIDTASVTFSNNEITTVIVGAGGIGAEGFDNFYAGNGQNSKFKDLEAVGGGAGGSSINVNTAAIRNGASGGSGGGGAGESLSNRSGGSGTANQGYAGGAGVNGGSGGGGGGASEAGNSDGTSQGGDGKTSNITGDTVTYAGGGGGGNGNTSTTVYAGGDGGGGRGGSSNSGAIAGTPGYGGGGGGAGSLAPTAPASSSVTYSGANGGSGVVIISWITASSPTYTTLTNVETTTALTRYTFRSGGSATSPLTRTYLWQYSSDTGTTWNTVQASTSDSYTTGLLDLGTSGTRYKYRVIVTDSDTAGLFITDSSTSYLVINRYPTISPPTSNDSGLLVHLDASESSSYSGSGTTWADIGGGNKNASLGISSGGPVVAGTSPATCSAPNYSQSNGGNFSFTGNVTAPRNCAWISGSTFSNVGETYTVEMWVKPAVANQVQYSALISTPWIAGDKINFTIAFDGTQSSGNPNIYGGVFDGSTWFTTPPTPITFDSWSHVVLVSANRTLTLYVNGESKTERALSSAPSGAGKGVLIGRRWDVNDTFNGSIGTVRISNQALTSTQIRQNYYLSSNRFSSSATGVKSSTTTYASILTETFTATNGTGTKIFTFSPNNRAGIIWDTSTANTAVLRVTSALNVGTYYETMTAMDSATAASTLALTITVDKARQASLSIGQYNAYPGVSTYPLNVYGGSGTGSVTRTRLTAGTANCTLTDGLFLSATSPGTCSVQAVKAGDINYYSETATATIYWIQWSDAYATRAPSTPTEIVLNHQTAITKYNYETLTVTSYQNASGTTITSIATGAVLRIIGDGFDPAAAYTEVVFASMDAVDLTSGLQVVSNGSGGYYLQLTMPSGVTTGAITVNSPKGTARGPSLTITP